MKKTSSLIPFVAMVRKDLVLYFSNRRALLMSIVAPIVIAAFFGYLFDSGAQKPSRIPVAVSDLDQSAISKKIVASMSADTTLEVRDMSEADALDAVKHGTLRAALVLPAGFGAQAQRALFRSVDKPVIALRYDPSQPMALAVVRGLLAQYVMQSVTQVAFSGNTMISDARRDIDKDPTISPESRRDLESLFASVERIQKRPSDATGADASSAPAAPALSAQDGNSGGGLRMPYEAHEEQAIANNTRTEYNSFAHSFAGMGVQFILFMGLDLGMGVLLARRMGLWKRLRAAPLSRSMLLGTRVASGALIAFALLLIIFAAAIAFFGVRILGSTVGFVAVAAAFGLLTSSFGLLIAALGKTPEATRGLAVLATLIMVMLGGAWVPSFIFPEWLQQVSLLVPTRWAIDGLDAMTWRGLGIESAVGPVAAMLGFSLVFTVIAVLRFKWEE